MIIDETNRKNLIFLILQFLHEEGYLKSLHLYGLPLILGVSHLRLQFDLCSVCFCYRLEQDSGVFFDYSYFSCFITNGNWRDAEDYLSAFTSPDANTFSRKMFVDLYKWKFSEAAHRQSLIPTLFFCQFC